MTLCFVTWWDISDTKTVFPLHITVDSNLDFATNHNYCALQTAQRRATLTHTHRSSKVVLRCLHNGEAISGGLKQCRVQRLDLCCTAASLSAPALDDSGVLTLVVNKHQHWPNTFSAPPSLLLAAADFAMLESVYLKGNPTKNYFSVR